MAQEYDKIIKENVEQVFLALAEKFLGFRIVSKKSLNPKMETTLEREADYLKQIVTGNKEKFVLHLEFQTNDDREMVYRMAEYKGIIIRKYKLPIRQHVVYLGKKPSKMQTQLPPKFGIEGFVLHSLREVDHQTFLSSDVPEEILLAILADMGRKPPFEVIRKIVGNLKRVSDSDTKLRRYLTQLTVLGRLRNLESEVKEEIKTMPIIYDTSRVKDDPWFKEGREEGREEGIEEGIEKGREGMVVNLLKMGKLSVEDIALAAEASIAFVLKVKADLNKH